MSDISSVKETKAPANPGSKRKFDWADGIYLGGVVGLNPAAAQFVQIDPDNGVTITATDKVTVNATASTFNGDVAITGNLTVTGTATANDFVTTSGVSLKTHVHKMVKTGTDLSGVPNA
jgi:phage baseplate assembly protein gpV